jgi:hypothetical protein
MAPKFAQPAFNLTYSTPAIDIGAGYAKGIETAGQALSGAIKNVADIATQNQTANDLLSQLSQTKDAQGNALLDADTYKSLMGKGLGAKQAYIGQIMTNWADQYKSLLDQQRQIQVAQATAATQAPYRIQEIQATGAEQRKTAEATRAVTGGRPIVIGQPNPQSASGADRITSPLKSALQSGQDSVLNKKFGLGG